MTPAGSSARRATSEAPTLPGGGFFRFWTCLGILRNMDTLTRPSTASAAVNKDIVESVVECAGYSRRVWTLPLLFTVFHAITAGLLLLSDSLLAAGAMWMLGAVAVLWMLGMQADHQSMTLSMRNALERRFGLPEYARHRHDYSPFWDGE